MSDKKATGITEGIESFLDKLPLIDQDFKKTPRSSTTAAHRKIVKGILEQWRKTDGFGQTKTPYAPPGRTYGLDIVGRVSEYGKILMSVEVDTQHVCMRSWMKLLDIRSENRVWIYVTKHQEEKARTNLEESRQEILSLIEARGDNTATLDNFVVFLKTPTTLVKEVLCQSVKITISAGPGGTTQPPPGTHKFSLKEPKSA